MYSILHLSGRLELDLYKQYVLADLYAWLEAHSGLSHSYVTTAASTIGANTSSLNTNMTSPGSSSSKR